MFLVEAAWFVYSHHPWIFFSALSSIIVLMSSFHDLLLLSVKPCMFGVLAALCDRVIPFSSQNCSIFFYCRIPYHCLIKLFVGSQGYSNNWLNLPTLLGQFAVFLGGMSISFFAMSLVVTEMISLPFLSNHFSVSFLVIQICCSKASGAVIGRITVTGNCFHCTRSDVSWISETRLAMNVWNRRLLLAMYCNTVFESLQKMPSLMLTVNSCLTRQYNLTAKTAAWSCKRGMLNYFTGAKRFLAITNKTLIVPSGSEYLA